jgi:hypothetical protein
MEGQPIVISISAHPPTQLRRAPERLYITEKEKKKVKTKGREKQQGKSTIIRLLSELNNSRKNDIADIK